MARNEEFRAKALLIGPELLEDFMQQIKPEWDWVPGFSSIGDFQRALSNKEIDPNELQAIFLFDGLFDATGSSNVFQRFVANLCPYYFFCIISYRPDYQEQIRQKVTDHIYSIGGDESAAYYFINKDKPAPSLDDAIQKYVSAPNQTPEQRDVARMLQGLPPLEENEKEDPIGVKMMEQDDEPSDYLGQVVAVTSSKGGSGKSTTALTLATYLAHAGENSYKEGLEDRPLKVAIVDLDTRMAQLGLAIGITKPTVTNLFLDGFSEESIKNNSVYSEKLKCQVFLAPRRPRTAKEIPPSKYAELIALLKKQFDYIILDTSIEFLDPILEEVAYPMANQILFVTDSVVPSVYGMAKWIDDVTKPRENGGMGINPKKIGIILNKSMSDINLSADAVAQAAMGIHVIAVLPSIPRVVSYATNTQHIEILIKHRDFRLVFAHIAKALVGKKYQLSDNVD